MSTRLVRAGVRLLLRHGERRAKVVVADEVRRGNLPFARGARVAGRGVLAIPNGELIVGRDDVDHPVATPRFDVATLVPWARLRAERRLLGLPHVLVVEVDPMGPRRQEHVSLGLAGERRLGWRRTRRWFGRGSRHRGSRCRWSGGRAGRGRRSRYRSRHRLRGSAAAAGYDESKDHERNRLLHVREATRVAVCCGTEISNV